MPVTKEAVVVSYCWFTCPLQSTILYPPSRNWALEPDRDRFDPANYSVLTTESQVNETYIPTSTLNHTNIVWTPLFYGRFITHFLACPEYYHHWQAQTPSCHTSLIITYTLHRTKLHSSVNFQPLCRSRGLRSTSRRLIVSVFIVA